jgi:hypothetical protein
MDLTDGPSREPISFSAAEIYRLFGPEAAEDEDAARPREYYSAWTNLNTR